MRSVFTATALSRADGMQIHSPREHLCFVEGSTPSLIAALLYDVLKIATAGKAMHIFLK